MDKSLDQNVDAKNTTKAKGFGRISGLCFHLQKESSLIDFLHSLFIFRRGILI